MNPTGYDINHQWNGPRDISTRQQFAAVIRDITGIDTWYPVVFEFGKSIICGFKIASDYLFMEEKHGYYWRVKYDSNIEEYRGHENGMIIYSDYWTACVDLARYIGCTDREINDIFWNGKSREEIGCTDCPCNHVEGKEKR